MSALINGHDEDVRVSVPGRSGTRPGTRRVPARGSGRRPRGSRIDDVTSGRIAPGGLARIERRRIVSRWARITQAGPGPRRTQHAPPRARRPAPARSPPHPIPSRPAPRERVLTRENVCRGYDLEDRRRSRDPGGAPGAAARTRVAAGSVLAASKTNANELIDTGPGTRTGAATRLRP